MCSGVCWRQLLPLRANVSVFGCQFQFVAQTVNAQAVASICQFPVSRAGVISAFETASKWICIRLVRERVCKKRCAKDPARGATCALATSKCMQKKKSQQKRLTTCVDRNSKGLTVLAGATAGSLREAFNGLRRRSFLLERPVGCHPCELWLPWALLGRCQQLRLDISVVLGGGQPCRAALTGGPKPWARPTRPTRPTRPDQKPVRHGVTCLWPSRVLRLLFPARCRSPSIIFDSFPHRCPPSLLPCAS